MCSVPRDVLGHLHDRLPAVVVGDGGDDAPVLLVGGGRTGAGCAIRAIRSPIALCASAIVADQRRRMPGFGEREVQAHVELAVGGESRGSSSIPSTSA